MRGKLYEAISRRNFLKGSGTAAVAAAALPAGMVRSLPAEAAVPDTPFPHGLASGDPQTDRVMLWTRLSPEFVEASASPGQAGVRYKPRCKGCKVETIRTGDSKAKCKGCKVERSAESSAKVQVAGLRWEVIGPFSYDDLKSELVATPKVRTLEEATSANEHAVFDMGPPAGSGSAKAVAGTDYTVKVDVKLKGSTSEVAGKYYFYRFSYGDHYSPIARTKTLPATTDRVKLAVVSCSSIPHGYFNAYGALAGLADNNTHDEQNFDDVDVVLCLGDYIYEYAQHCYPEGEYGGGRESEPLNEIVSLSDYRTRHRQYKSDPDLQALHRKFPMINVWDDHETADNAYPNGAVNHTPGGPDSGPTAPNGPEDAEWSTYHCNESGGGRLEGDWYERLEAGKRAYFEYLPVRPNPDDPYRLYRTFNFGGLADLIMLDTRLLREGPGCPTVTENSAEGAEICDMFDQGGYNQSEDRYLLGKKQFQWLGQELDKSTATWQVLGQQIMVGQLRVVPNVLTGILGASPFAGFPNLNPSDNGAPIPEEGVIFITDLWDGWQESRKRLYVELDNVNLAGTESAPDVLHAGKFGERVSTRTTSGNVVILTGDIHTSWAHDIHPAPYSTDYVPATGDGSKAVEFVCPSVTSTGLGELAPIQDLIRSANPQVNYIDLAKHGFMTVVLTAEKVEGTWHNVQQIDATNYVLDGNPVKLSADAGEHHFNETCFTPTGQSEAPVVCAPKDTVGGLADVPASLLETLGLGS